MMPVAQVPVSKLIRHYRGPVVAAAPAWFCCRSLAAPLGTAPDGVLIFPFFTTVSLRANLPWRMRQLFSSALISCSTTCPGLDCLGDAIYETLGCEHRKNCTKMGE
jgi:hypothetical protein